MLVSYKWLNEYLDLSEITPKELADKMSVTGIEVEGIDVPEEGLKNRCRRSDRLPTTSRF